MSKKVNLKVVSSRILVLAKEKGLSNSTSVVVSSQNWKWKGSSRKWGKGGRGRRAADE